GDLSFAISRRLSHPDGSFAGVVMGAISLSNLRSAFASLKLGKDGALNLLRNDGVILMRQPFVEEDINRDLSKSENFQRFVRERSGAFVGTSSVDGVRRLFTFAPVGRLPVFLTVAVSVEEILSSWWKKAVVLGVITTLLCSAVVSLTYLFQRELSRRRIAEAELAQLASTDGLTGLPNRRAFDATLAREWADAIRSGRPLSVLFIDADFFKGFNDHYGHGKGDDLLTTIAKVVRSELHRPRDYVARYGGEEFTVLLPDADLGHALTVAENMRNALLGRGILHATSSHNVATISVGVASIVPL
ncbi:diguanylate cyclase, partial [Corallococcus exiguus]|uniref:diguanylate cyclase n=1 Tax=Corallococcus exiguus TaxID=83462 RepID=UPI001473BF16